LTLETISKSDDLHVGRLSVTRPVPLVEHKRFNLPMHLGSPLFISEVRDTQYLVFCVVSGGDSYWSYCYTPCNKVV